MKEKEIVKLLVLVSLIFSLLVGLGFAKDNNGFDNGFEKSSGKHQYLRWEAKLVRSDKKTHVLNFTFQLKNKIHIHSNKPLTSNYIPTVLEVFDSSSVKNLRVQYPEPITATYYGEELSVYRGSGGKTIKAYFELVEDLQANGVLEIPFAFRFQPCDEKYCYPPETISGVAKSETKIGKAKLSESSKGGFTGIVEGGSLPTNLALALALGFLGGLLLNFMPCVFPLLTLKAYSLMKITARDKQKSKFKKNQIKAFILGSFISFLGLGILLALFKGLGNQASWGIQFQNPFYILILTIIFWIMSLNLLDVFKLDANISYSLGFKIAPEKKIMLENFFSGALLTLFSTSCTAPFLGIALGYALTQSSMVILVFFSIIGLGFVSPYFLILFFKDFSRYLPKPGPWLEVFKHFTAFPIFVIVIWFISVLNALVSFELVFRALLFLCLLAFLLYFWGKLQKQRYFKAFYSPMFYGFLVVITVMFLVFLSPQVKINAKNSGIDFTNTQEQLSQLGKVGNSNPFTPQAFEAQLENGNLFYVHYTAEWCLNCKFNGLVLEGEVVKDFFKENDVVYFVADWTRPNPFITEKIAELNRAGIPLDVYYYVLEGDLQSYILPTILTEENIISAFNKVNSF